MSRSSWPDVPAGIFRAYDIRGIVGETLTAESVFMIGKAIGSLVREQGGNQVAIARDGRLSGVALLDVLCDGLLSTGCDVMHLGMLPTPLLYYAAAVSAEHSAVMLTGSHNPPEYNGFKIVINGKTLAQEGIQHLHERIVQGRLIEGEGRRFDHTVVEAYVREMTAQIKLKKRLKVVIDAGNGVTGMIAPRLFRELGCEVEELFCEVDGRFPHHHPDPSQPENLQDLIAAVEWHQADVGLAWDGDGDRLGVVTNRGRIIYPDHLLILFAQSVLAACPQAQIIYDVKCTQHLASAVRALGGESLMWKTGHSLIKAKMAETGAKLAGEMSGHFFFKDRWYGFDDGLYAGARLLELLSQSDQDMDGLFSSLPRSVSTPELKVAVREEDKFELMHRLLHRAADLQATELTTLDGVRAHFADGWGLVRASNTAPYLILRFEANSLAILDKLQSVFRKWMLSVQPGLELPF